MALNMKKTMIDETGLSIYQDNGYDLATVITRNDMYLNGVWHGDTKLTGIGDGTLTGAIKTLSDSIGTLSSLTTSVKSSLVSAINELRTNIQTHTTQIGTLSSLSTTAKGNLVAAVNELNTNKVNIVMKSEALTCQAGVVRVYTFTNLPTHQFSFPVITGATVNAAGCTAGRDANTTGKVWVYSPIAQNVSIQLVMIV